MAAVPDLRAQCHLESRLTIPAWRITVSGFVDGEFHGFEFDHVTPQGDLAAGIGLAVVRFQGRHCKGEHL